MNAFLSALSLITPDPDSTTRRDRAEARAAVARLSYRWAVAERTYPPGMKGTARRHLVVELHGAVAIPAFRLDRHGNAVMLSEHDDAGAWMLGQFGSMADALAMLRREAIARFAGAGNTPALEGTVA